MHSVLLQPLPAGDTPAFLTIGHVTRDLQADGSFTPGGTVTFAALTAYHLGLVSAVVTCADDALIAQLPALMPGIALAVHPTSVTTTFENRYRDGSRIQYLRQRAPQLELADIPAAWLTSPVMLLGPLAQELSPELLRQLPRQPGSLLAATPQGWLRRWDADGHIWPIHWETAGEILPLLDALILSHEDLLPFADSRQGTAAILTDWSKQVPLLVATDGYRGATLFEHGVPTHFPAYPAHEVDPTGAGDVFAAAFLTHLYQHREPHAAMNFANCAASLSIEHPAISGIPTLADIQKRLHPLN